MPDRLPLDVTVMQLAMLLECSTPFGIRGRSSYGSSLAAAGVRMCSTPFGIRGRSSRVRSGGHAAGARAQRLSASEEEAAQEQEHSLLESLCSTPFGIRGRSRGLPGCNRKLRPTCSTPFGIRGRSSPILSTCGQVAMVLNAFRHQRKKQWIDPSRHYRDNACAQRLSASEEEAAVRPCEKIRRQVGVLNAFRHQRKKQSPCMAAPFPLSGGVLNAFRHQRKKQTRGSAQGDARCAVLNAFRHQRKKQRRLCQTSSMGRRCSTPFGIRGRSSRVAGVRCLGLQQCSTPFGIRGRSRISELKSIAKNSNVLNAFRHQRKKQTLRLACRRGRMPSAQRLSASEEEAD